MIKNGIISNDLFNQHIEEFNDLILQSLRYVPYTNGHEEPDAKLSIINNFKKDIDVNASQREHKAYVMTSIRLLRPRLPESLTFDFTISYDDFYQVPVLYFRAFERAVIDNKNMVVQTGLRPINSIEYLISKYNLSLGFKNEMEIGAIITLDSHHLLADNCVWFYVHPCETVATMKDFSTINHFKQETETERMQVLKYLSTWFGIYGLCGIFPSISFRPCLQAI